MLNSRRGPPSPSAFASPILDLSQIDSYAHLLSMTTMQSFFDLFIINRSGTSDLERAAYMGLTPPLKSASALSLHHTHPPKSAATILPYCVMFGHIHIILSIQPGLRSYLVIAKTGALTFKSLQAFNFGRELHQNQPISGDGVMRVSIVKPHSIRLIHLVPV